MIGFDYGTSNCAVGVIQNNRAELVELAGHGKFMASTLYAPSRDIIPNWLFKKLNTSQQQAFANQRIQQLQKGRLGLHELSLDGISPELFFGQAALQRYLDDPEEGYYIKSPKSFLGASGLKQPQIELFEDIVAAMMTHVKHAAEASLGYSVDSTVIGRPVNFQGLNGQESNNQAINILTNAARRVGFKHIEFQYEPVAAGFEYETQLTAETKVLVVDIGGGTSDCSMQLMGPEFIQLPERSHHLLGHQGQRIGGNDLDIQLAVKTLMPNLGMLGQLKSGKPIPVNSFWQAMAINDINAQTDFYSPSNGRFLSELQQDAQQPEQIALLRKVYLEKLSYQLVNCAEQAKIALTEEHNVTTDLSFLSAGLSQIISPALFANAIQRELAAISQLMLETVKQAGCEPDVIFVTGGTAKSPILRKHIEQTFNKPLVVGDHFGSVTAGLARDAQRKFA